MISAEERAFADALLTESLAALEASVAGLSGAQFRFRPDADSWSVALILEHLYAVEAGIQRGIRQAPGSEETDAARDRRIVKGIRDRSVKVAAPERAVPTGRSEDPVETLEKLRRARERTREWLADGGVEHRAHALPHPFLKMLDGYQWLLMLGAHMERHTGQIEELKANPQFPAAEARA